jgi:hypothetical protein
VVSPALRCSPSNSSPNPYFKSSSTRIRSNSTASRQTRPPSARLWRDREGPLPRGDTEVANLRCSSSSLPDCYAILKQCRPSTGTGQALPPSFNWSPSLKSSAAESKFLTRLHLRASADSLSRVFSRTDQKSIRNYHILHSFMHTASSRRRRSSPTLPHYHSPNVLPTNRTLPTS